MRKIYINGRFLTQKITGVQRFGIEVTKMLDEIAQKGEIEILSPPGIINDLNLTNIRIRQIGRKSNNLWVQLTLPLYVKIHHGLLLTLSGMLPVLCPDFFVCHDVTFRRFPGTFSRAFEIMYYLDFKLTLHRCKTIFTISHFSKNEICNVFKMKNSNFELVSPSSEHLLLKDYNDISVSKWGLSKGEYYLSVSSRARHKNQNFISELAKKSPDKKFVIIGGRTQNIKEYKQEQVDNLVHTGYVTDDELYSIYKNAKGFIFPSLYEGFGLPPLEAITMGIRHIAVSDIEVFREIYDRDVYFFDPFLVNEFDFDIFSRIEISESTYDHYLEKYSWNKTAKVIYNTIKNKWVK